MDNPNEKLDHNDVPEKELDFWLMAAIFVPLGIVLGKFVLLPLFKTIFAICKTFLINLGVL